MDPTEPARRWTPTARGWLCHGIVLGVLLVPVLLSGLGALFQGARPMDFGEDISWAAMRLSAFILAVTWLSYAVGSSTVVAFVNRGPGSVALTHVVLPALWLIRHWLH